MNAFHKLGLEDHLIQAVTDLGFETPSEVQEKTIPLLLEDDIDLVALAQTGTGKTAAFGFPMLQKIDIDSRTTQGLILSPTRELCLQITNEMKLYGKHCKGLNVTAIYGGASITDQAKQVKRGAQIIVATPGRMKDMISRRLVDISKIEYAVLDEADEMLNMGFFEDITEILSHTPDEKSTWLFSATMPKEVSLIAKKFMANPTEVTVGHKNMGSKNVSHEYFLVGARDRYQALKRLADANPEIFSVIFCRTKRDTQKVAEQLIEDGYNAGALHGDLSQNQRDVVMKSFRAKQIQMLVATDVAARGLDVNSLTHVINHKLPDQIENYTHRSGRTGRAGKTGISIALVSSKEKGRIGAIERIIKQKFVLGKVPSGKEICQNQLMHLIDKVNAIEVKESEIVEFLPSIYEKLEGLTREELIQKFVSLEFNSFLSYYENAKDLNDLSSRDNSRGGRSVDENMTRFFINIGRKDSLNPAKLIGLINDQKITDNIEIGAIDILDTFSFFEIDKKFEEETLSTFSNNQPEFSGRGVNIEITKKERGVGGGGARRGRKPFGNKDGGGFGKRRSSEGFSGGRRSEGSIRGRSSSRSGGDRPDRNSSSDRKPSGFGRKRRDR